MQPVCSVVFKSGTREELLPNFDPKFPHITTYSGLEEGDSAPWHWHKAVELFYVAQGCLEYVTPSDRHLFRTGSGGLINTNVPHMTRGHQVQPSDLELIHLFDPVLIAGTQGSRIEESYVLPLTTARQVEMIALEPNDPCHRDVLDLLQASFRISAEDTGYEIQLRAVLSKIWLRLLDIVQAQLGNRKTPSINSERIKQMMVFIHDHYSEKISVAMIAASAHISERTCFELFKTHLHLTPMDYVNSYRLRMARQMLVHTEEPVTVISAACGLGSSSYFGKVFRQTTGLTALEYRKQTRSPDTP